MSLRAPGRNIEVGEAVRKLNPHIFGAAGNVQIPGSREPTVPQPAVPVQPPRRIRQNQKPLLNKLETEWFNLVRESYPSHTIRPQALRFRLANGAWYKPDLTAMLTGINVAWEVKGPHAFRGGFEFLKVAAATYPEWRWILVWKDESGKWQEQTVLP